jgi:hypothetical protein
MKRNLLKSVFIACLLTAGSAVGVGASTPRNPILSLPKSVQSHFACIIYRESRSTFVHLNLGDNNRYGASGIFQIEQITWQAHQKAAGVPYKVHVWQASPLQQEQVAIAIWRADSFNPWRGDGC